MAAMIDSRYIEQRKMEARMLNAMGDWRGLNDVLAELRPLLRRDHHGAREFYRELASFNVLHAQLSALLP